MKVDVFDAAGRPVRGAKGELVCTMPFPSMPVGFWNDPDGRKYHAAYFDKFPGVWCHGDYVELTKHGGMIIYGRSDAVLNPGGVRIGTAEIYRQVEQLEEVVESLVVGQQWDGDERVVLFVRLRDGLTLNDRDHPENQGSHPPQHDAAPRPGAHRPGRRDPAHQKREDRRAGRPRRHSQPRGQEPRGARESRSARAVPQPAASCSDMICIRRSAAEALIAHARSEAPRECCGLLIGQAGLVERVVPAVNVRASDVSYLDRPARPLRRDPGGALGRAQRRRRLSLAPAL